MRYWDQKKKEEQEKFSDEENDVAAYNSKTKYSLDDTEFPKGYSRLKTSRPSSSQDTASDSGYSNGLEAVRVWQEKSNDFETKFRESMVSNAQLYNEKTALIYSVEVLKDRMEDLHQELAEARAEKNREQSQVLHQRHHAGNLANEIETLKKMIEFRDEFLEKLGLHLPTGEEGEEEQEVGGAKQDLGSEERDRLTREIESLKEEIASMKSSSLLGDQQPRDIVQVSTRMVSEYKTKLQIAEADNTRLDGMVTRLKGQVTRYKTQVKELEEREDQLMKEKRLQGKDIRSLQSECEDYKTEVDLLKRRIEQLRKRSHYASET